MEINRNNLRQDSWYESSALAYMVAHVYLLQSWNNLSIFNKRQHIPSTINLTPRLPNNYFKISNVWAMGWFSMTVILCRTLKPVQVWHPLQQCTK
jgi:hypothetical protein